ncbi:MAG: beta-phosphoglucomutase [Bacteroidetes bacterium]|nr:MAG: beta-phosphoglucomutase [Bacteroidota bacterium]
MIKGCIFDLDGVIVDTAKYHYLAWKELAESLGFAFTEKDNERLKGVSRMRSLDILLEIGGKQLDDETKLKFAENKNKKYLEYILKMTPDEILPGIINFLEDLRSKNIKIALGSASKNAMTILNQLNLTNYFNAVIDGTKVSNAKPDPEVFLKGAEALNLKPEECLVFEDAEAGIEAAINGGFKCVGIGSPENLSKANYIMSGFEDITFDKIIELI